MHHKDILEPDAAVVTDPLTEAYNRGRMDERERCAGIARKYIACSYRLWAADAIETEIRSGE